MFIKREWVTPVVVGAFLISSVTGVLMFFHLDMSLNKAAHEWLSWLLLIGVIFHLTTHFKGFKRYFNANKARLIIGFSAFLLLLSFVPFGGGGKPPFVQPIAVLASTPVSTLASVAQVTPEIMIERLDALGVQVESEQQSLDELVGDDFGRKMNLLNELLQE